MFPDKDIYFIQKEHKHIVVHLRTEQRQFKMTLDKIMKALDSSMFVLCRPRCNRCISQHINEIRDHMVHLDNGEVVTESVARDKPFEGSNHQIYWRTKMIVARIILNILRVFLEVYISYKLISTHFELSFFAIDGKISRSGWKGCCSCRYWNFRVQMLTLFHGYILGASVINWSYILILYLIFYKGKHRVNITFMAYGLSVMLLV